jgi:hypothetical protein
MVKEFCKECQTYQDRVKMAEALNEIFGTEGNWDFETCWQSCPEKHRLYNKRQADYYWRNKEMKCLTH